MGKVITKAQRAASLGVSPMTLYRWERAGKVSTERSIRGRPAPQAYPWMCYACGAEIKASPDTQPTCTCGVLMQPVISKWRAKRKVPIYFKGSTTWDELANQMVSLERCGIPGSCSIESFTLLVDIEIDQT